MSYQDIPFVFDWLATPIDAVGQLIAKNFSDFFKTENLVWKQHADFWSVEDSQYGIVSNHHFKLGPPETIEDVQQLFQVFARRFMDRLRGDSDVIFLRRWIEEDGDKREAAARDLHETIRQFRPGCVFLYLQPHEAVPPVIDGTFIRAFNPGADVSASWSGYSAIYDRNFSRALAVLRQAKLAVENFPAARAAGDQNDRILQSRVV
jgi:hypothetical protein